MTAKRNKRAGSGWAGFLIVLAACLPGLLPAGTATPAVEKALDIEKFKRELERSHALVAKHDRNHRRQLKTLDRITKKAPGFPGPWTALARLEASTGNFRRAEQDHLRALAASDRWTGPALAYSEFLSVRGRKDDAAALLRSVLSTQPGDPALSYALAEVLQSSEPETARDLWDSLFRADRERIDAAFKAATLEYSRGRYREAFERFEKLHGERPRDAEILALCVESARKAGRPEKASGYIEKLALGTAECSHLEAWIEGAPKNPLAACRRAHERNPRCPGVLVRTGEVQERSGDFHGAFRAYAAAFRLDPEDRTLLARLKTLAGQLLEPMPDPGPFLRLPERNNIWSKAEAEMNAGNWKKAFSVVKRVPFRRDMEFGQPFLLRMAEAAKGDDELMRWADSLARTCHREGTFVYAAALQGSGRSARADEMLRKSVETWFMDPFPCERLGRLRVALGFWDAAGKVFEEADRRDWRGRWILDEARCALEKGDGGMATRLYLSVLGRRVFQAEAYQGLMRAYERNRMPQEALAAARLWAQAEPLSKEAWEAFRRWETDPKMRDLIDRVLGVL